MKSLLIWAVNNSYQYCPDEQSDQMFSKIKSGGRPAFIPLLSLLFIILFTAGKDIVSAPISIIICNIDNINEYNNNYNNINKYNSNYNF